MKMLYVSVFFLFTINLFAQSFVIRKVLDNNILVLQDGNIIEIAEFLTPSRDDSTFGSLSNEIFHWVNDKLVNEPFRVAFNKSKTQAWLFYESNGSDLRVDFLSRGYGMFMGEHLASYKELLDAERFAKNNKLGIWAFPDSVIENFKANKEQYSNYSKYATNENANLNPQIANYQNKKVTHPYVGLLLLTAVCGYLAYDFLSDAADIGEGIDALKSVFGSRVDTSELEDKKSSKMLGGIISIAAGVAIMIVALQPVEVYTGPNSITVSYRF